MKVNSATLGGGRNNQDRHFIIDKAVVVLDGASASTPLDVDAGLYAETLGAAISQQLQEYPTIPIADAVAAGINFTSRELALVPGRSPSSTVSVLRIGLQEVDFYTLGDNVIHFGSDTR